MAKTTKKTTTIQPVVDAYAAGIVRRGLLQKQTEKNETTIRDAVQALTAHVAAAGATSSTPVAYQARNGRTVLVYSHRVHSVEPGKLKVEREEPATAAIADQVAKLLAQGAATEAQALIEQKLIESANTAKTATELLQRDWAAVEPRVMAHWYTGRLAFPKLCVDSAKREPAIEQQTYKSATMGLIRLSKRAKELLVENREAIQRAIRSADYNAQGMIVSKSRGRIAQYISELEQRVNVLQAQVDDNRANRA